MTQKSLILKGLLSLGVAFLLLQFIGFKLFIDNAEKRKRASPWEDVESFVNTCNHLKLPVFVVELSLLRALRDGGSMLELWDRGRHPVITFGVIEATIGDLHSLLSALDAYVHLGINTPDPRNLSLDSKPTYRTIPAHYFLWHPTYGGTVLHLVVFYHRQNYLWFSAAVNPHSVQPPLNVSHLSIGEHPGSIERFSIKEERVRGVRLSIPTDTSSFVWKLQHSKFTECNYARASDFFMTRGKNTIQDMPFRRTARQLLSIVSKTLDAIEMPFWISSGTCLGWFRQCDIIPYSKDVDIGIRISDYREELITSLELKGLKLIHQFGKVTDSFELSFAYADVKLDIFFFYEEKGYIWNGGTQVKTGKKFKYSFPKFSLCWTEFLGLRVRVPDPPLPYIEANYGKHWEFPVKEWDWKKSPPNVVENGEWPPEERDDVIQLFE